MKEWEEEFEEWWLHKFDAPEEVKKSFGYLQQQLFAKEAYLAACEKREARIRELEKENKQLSEWIETHLGVNEEDAKLYSLIEKGGEGK